MTQGQIISSYKDLRVWQKSFILAKNIYQITETFPSHELYGITNQMRRAAVSIPSNIAEGYSRQYRKEYILFLKTAFASGAELETQLLLAKELGYVDPHKTILSLELLTEVMKMLNSLISKLLVSSSA